MAAGLGFKTFTTGEVLTAADTNGYLMQGVNVFANAAARTAAITSPQEGQMSYLKDTNSTEYYTGSAWVAVGGSSGALALVKRATFSSVANTGTTFDGVFTSTYKSYMIVVESFGISAIAAMYFQWRTSAPATLTSTYYGGNIAGSTTGSSSPGAGSNNSSQLILSAQNSTGGTRGNINVHGVGNVSEAPTINYQITTQYDGLTSNGGGWTSTANTYTGFIISASSGNVSGTLAVYGLATS